MLCIENALVDSFHFIITCDGMVEVEDQDQSTLTRADATTPATDRTIGLLGQAVKTVENINSIPTGATYALRIIHRNHLSPQNEPIDYRDGKGIGRNPEDFIPPRNWKLKLHLRHKRFFILLLMKNLIIAWVLLVAAVCMLLLCFLLLYDFLSYKHCQPFVAARFCNAARGR